MIETKRMLITPEMAKAWLEKSTTHNRNVGKTRLANIVNALKTGRWEFNGETMIFDENGNILDGHTRLTACAQSGVPLESLVVFGVPARVLPTIDGTGGRTHADLLTFAGEKNTHVLASACRLVWLAEGDSLDAVSSSASKMGMTREELLPILARNPSLRASASAYHPYYKGFQLVTPSIWVFMMSWLPRYSPQKAESFLASLSQGTGLDQFDPVYQLRHRLIQNSLTKAKLPLLDILALIIKAWVFHAKGLKVQQLRWRTQGAKPEMFPNPNPWPAEDAEETGDIGF